MLLRLPRVLLWHLRFFQLLGLFPFQINNQRPSAFVERFLRFWPLIVLILYTVHTIHTHISKEEFFYTGDGFGYFNDVLKLDIAQLTITTIYMESLCRRKALHRFWQLYNELRGSENETKKGILQEISENSRFLSIFYGIQCFEFVVLIVFVFKTEIGRHLALFWCMFYPYMYTVHFRNMQFILHLEILRQQLEQLKRELAELVDYTQFARRIQPCQGFSGFLRSKILEKQKKYQQIYEMFENLQKAFGVSMVSVLLMFYVRVLVDVYFAYYTSRFAGNSYESGLLLPSLLEIPFFLFASRNCMNVVKHLTFQLHNIIRQADDVSISVQLQNFSLQILHSPIKITGIGIATMDGYMLTRTVGSMTTYMVFFIQFMPKVRSY